MASLPENMTFPIKIGTRGSPLALAQAYQTRDRLKSAFGLNEDDFKIEVISTTGDRVQDKTFLELGGKGLFTKEIEVKLANGDIDIAVHSMKDVPTYRPNGMEIVAILPREDVRDAFISTKYNHIDDLPKGAKIGTSSLRRGAILKSKRPDLEVVEFRGNVQTRLKKLFEGEVDATLLAVAGLNRLGMNEVMTYAISAKDMLPAVSQGAIGLEARSNDTKIIKMLLAINCADSQVEVNMERAFLKALDGSCQTPISALAQVYGNQVEFKAMILRPDGSECHEASVTTSIGQAEQVGRNIGLELLEKGGPDFFEYLNKG